MRESDRIIEAAERLLELTKECPECNADLSKTDPQDVIDHIKAHSKIIDLENFSRPLIDTGVRRDVSFMIEGLSFGKVKSCKFDTAQGLLTIEVKMQYDDENRYLDPNHKGKRDHYYQGDKKMDKLEFSSIESWERKVHNMTPEQVIQSLITYPFAEWADGKQGYKLYLYGLSQGPAVKIPELQGKPGFAKMAKMLDNALMLSVPVMSMIHSARHDLFHMNNPDIKPEFEDGDK